MEVTLYQPVKAFLERLDFEVKGEVRGCDIVATRGPEPPLVVIVELKLGLSLELLLQAVDRMQIADDVWIAVPATRRGRDRDRRAHRLCRLLGIGLLAVNARRTSVEVLVEPAPYRPRANLSRRRLLLEEFTRRRGDPAQGGSTRRPIMTAYRQQALDCAAALRDGPKRPRDLRAIAPDAGSILLRNVYGWFERVQHGIYRLGPLGEQALGTWLPELALPPLQSAGSKGRKSDGLSRPDRRSVA
jgi:hypothetical protein